MDPVATLKKILDAFVENTTTPNAEEYTRQEALEALGDLADWIGNGGVMPMVTAIESESIYKIG